MNSGACTHFLGFLDGSFLRVIICGGVIRIKRLTAMGQCRHIRHGGYPGFFRFQLAQLLM